MCTLSLNENFEPSSFTKKLWLYTRKRERTIGGVVLPGIFQTSGSTGDALGTIVVIILEIVGLGLLNYYSNIQLLFAIFLFFGDLVFVILKNYPARGKICDYKNKISIESSEDEIARFTSKIKNLKFYSHLWTVAIILIALFKIGAFYAAVRQINGVTFLIILTYVVVALLHNICTGYFISQIVFCFFFSVDRRKYLKKRGVNTVTQHRTHTFNSSYELKVQDRNPESNEHALTKQDTSYTIHSWGILDDTFRDNFINCQKSEETRIKIAKEIIKHQLINILTTDPM